MSKPITIKAVRVDGPLQLTLDWSTAETLRVDFAGLVKPPFDALKDPEFFAQVALEPWGGHGLDWPNGLSMDADRLYELCREQAGLLTPNAFNDWMRRNGLSLQTAAESLGMTRRMIAYYRTGSRAIPRVVGLACKGWEAERRLQA
jgi:hypothetical protein